VAPLWSMVPDKSPPLDGSPTSAVVEEVAVEVAGVLVEVKGVGVGFGLFLFEPATPPPTAAAMITTRTTTMAIMPFLVR
jgi:hypothetical protein